MSFRNIGEPRPSAPCIDTVAMLLTQAKNVVQQVFDLRGIAPPAQMQHLQSVYERMEIQPHQDKKVDLTIRQGKVAIGEQLTEHADAALQQAVYVKLVHDNHLPLQSVPGAAAAYELCLQDMITALMRANRHLAMLEALKNLEGKHYSVRGAKGGACQKHAALQQDGLSTYSRHG